MQSTMYFFALLVAASVGVVLATARWKWHPFLVLLCAALGFGLAAALSPREMIGPATDGFGNTPWYIGIVIAYCTIIGTILEKSGGALVLAQEVAGRIGTRKGDLAMGITGSVVSVPATCDFGFIVLAPLIRRLARQTPGSLVEGVAGIAVVLVLGFLLV